MANDSSDKILKNASLITMCVMASRVTGLLRTWAMAFALGNTLLTSSYQVAYNLPSMIYELAAGGILSASFLPLYLLQKERHGTEAAHKFASNFLNLTLVFLGAIAVACSIFSPAVIQTQTFTVSGSEEQQLAAFFFRIFAVQIVLYGVGAIITGMLNGERNYLGPSLAPVLNNIVVTIVMFGYVPISAWNPEFALWWLGIGTSLGVAVQFMAQIPMLVKQGFHWYPRIDIHDPVLKEAIKTALPMFVEVIGSLVTVSCRNAFALETAPNGPSTLSYAWLWFQLPYGIIAVSVSTTLLTELSDCAAREDWAGFRKFVNKGIRTTMFLIIPLAALMGAMAVPLMQLFQAGAFTADQVTNVGSVLTFWVFSLPFYAGYMYLYRVFASMRQFLTFAIINVCMRVGLVLLYSQMCKPENFGLLGVPLSDFVFYVSMFFVCSEVIRRKIGSYGMKGIVGLIAKTAIAAIIAASVATILQTALTVMLEGTGIGAIPQAIIICVVVGIIGCVVAFGLCKLMRIPEFAILATIGKKVRGMLPGKAS